MEKIRYGNDITFRWTVKRDGQPEDFSKAITLRLLMRGTSSTVEVKNYKIDGSTITWLFAGKDQRGPSTYSLTLIENEGLDNMFTVDKCEVLQLASSSCCACDEDGPFTIDVESDICVPSNGLSAYELAVLYGFKGTEQEWLDSLKQPAVDAAGEAERTVRELVEASGRATEAANAAAAAAKKATTAITELGNRLVTAETAREKTEDARVQAELLRTQAEDARVQAELLRDSAERQRAAAEELRVKAEQLRVSAEGTRATAEEKRALAEQSRVTAEESRVKAETGRVDAESKRVTAEQSRATAETSRVQAEQNRVTAERQREETFATLKAESEQATKDATDAAMLAQENVLAIEFDQSTGTLSAVVGADNSAFTSGEITSDGEVVLDFDYEVTD